MYPKVTAEGCEKILFTGCSLRLFKMQLTLGGKPKFPAMAYRVVKLCYMLQ